MDEPTPTPGPGIPVPVPEPPGPDLIPEPNPPPQPPDVRPSPDPQIPPDPRPPKNVSDESAIEGSVDEAGSEIADGSNYRVSDRAGREIADGSNYRDGAEGSENADGTNYRVTDDPGTEVADGSNYRRTVGKRHDGRQMSDRAQSTAFLKTTRPRLRSRSSRDVAQPRKSARIQPAPRAPVLQTANRQPSGKRCRCLEPRGC